MIPSHPSPLWQTELKPTQTDDKSDAVTRSAYFPFCEYSPEWQALQMGQQYQAQLRFIDLPWTAQVNEDKLMICNPKFAERALPVHSLFISQLEERGYGDMMNMGTNF
ncbi:hypothetical protein J4727_18050 [Providencia rettgeri]|uniref:Uncharacterized protein n=1 Tax=Providencia rettgeri TaxID=587 RepID=A0A939NG90_PRORE|nr:hypothetical protein [Providencia rettgeri]